MPIAVKDYTWQENESTVYIKVPLKGVKSQRVDIFSTENYLKVLLLRLLVPEATSGHFFNRKLFKGTSPY